MSKTVDFIARISDLRHRYGGTLAVDSINLQIPAGCMVGLVGPDGVGKSSLLALISGVRKIQTGRVEVFGGDMGKSSHRTQVCSRIAYMPQGLGNNLYATLSVFENMDFFGRLFGQDRQERKWRIDELLHSTSLSSFKDRPAGKLSGGMKQKLGLCCALIHDPDLLILDEPTTGVDPLSRRQFWELINRIRSRRKGMSVLVSTAYMEEAEEFNWLVAMDDGKVLATGTPEELFDRTATSDLDSAFIELLPEEKRRGHKTLVVPPRVALDDGLPAIKAEGLTRRFGDFTAVDHVNFEIECGEIFGFLGSNGCGKTTTMKMLTGLLPASEGKALLFNRAVDAHDLATRKRVGFMSQAFSLYTELTVRQNLELHARLFHLPAERIPERIGEMIKRFDLADYEDELSARLPLGIRQRLSLAVAVIHAPEMLILDEPTSGVDPVARDGFWELLIDLSRNQGVTIFISTHFMNEAKRCDRISLMHAGHVLAQGTPFDLTRARDVGTLEEAFIAYLEDVAEREPEKADRDTAPIPRLTTINEPVDHGTGTPSSLGRTWAYARREAIEICRDPVRLAFALLGPLILMIVFGYGISFDVENLPYAALDRDQTPESRTFLENFTGSRYFKEHSPINNLAEMECRLRKGELRLAIEIPPDFGKDLKRGRQPQVGVWLDGAMPFRAETSRGYVQGLYLSYLTSLARRELAEELYLLPVDIEIRFRYNQEFKSVLAMVPGVIMLILVVIPAMLTAVGVVREKELGSIINLYATPVTGLEFLLGKQLPYVIIALVNFLSLMLLALFLFRVPVQGSFPALAVGATLYVIATTGFGLLVSTFVNSQVAAIFGAAIITLVPAVNFSGFLKPVASQSLTGKIMGYSFPSIYFDHISVGTFSKALGFGELSRYYVALVMFIFVYLGLTRLLLRTQGH